MEQNGHTSAAKHPFKRLKTLKRTPIGTMTINCILYCNRYRGKLQYISQKNLKNREYL